TYSLPKSFNAATIEIKNWDYSVTRKVLKRNSSSVALTGSPIFFSVVEHTCPQCEIEVAAKTESDTSIVISWEINFDFEGSFSIERSTEKDRGFIEIAASTEISFIDISLKPSTKYYYRIKLVSPENTILYSNTASATTQQEPPPALRAPSSLSAVSVSTSSVQLSWKDRNGDETGFVVEISEGGADNFTVLAELPANSTGYLSEGLKAGEIY